LILDPEDAGQRGGASHASCKLEAEMLIFVVMPHATKRRLEDMRRGGAARGTSPALLSVIPSQSDLGKSSREAELARAHGRTTMRVLCRELSEKFGDFVVVQPLDLPGLATLQIDYSLWPGKLDRAWAILSNMREQREWIIGRYAIPVRDRVESRLAIRKQSAEVVRHDRTIVHLAGQRQ
jgi:hypothetical protein